MIRPITPTDQDEVVSVVTASGLFGESELHALRGMLAAYFADDATQEKWLVDDEDGLVGIAYLAPERMTRGTWNLLLIAIHPERQRQGRGTRLVRSVEQLLKESQERVLLVETSGVANFEGVREFYRKNGYTEEARIREFYDTGDDKVIFRKSLAT